MRALVTGGAGFIGSNLVDALVARGDRVTVIDDLSTGSRANLTQATARGAELVVESITDADAMRRTVGEVEPETVFHLAAQIDVRRAVAEPAFDASVNIAGTINLLEAVREVGGASFVFISTGGAIYGEREARGVPVAEDAECLPEAPYGQSKLAAEGYVALYRRLYGVPGMSLRFANIYGPRQNPLTEAGVVAIFCGRLLASQPPIVFGDGHQTRDYVFVDDVVDATLAAERKLAEAGAQPLGPYNIGTGRETSVLELIELLSKLAGRNEWKPRIAPARTGEVQRIALDSRLASADLGWRAATDLDRGLELTLAAVSGGSPS